MYPMDNFAEDMFFTITAYRHKIRAGLGVIVPSQARSNYAVSVLTGSLLLSPCEHSIAPLPR